MVSPKQLDSSSSDGVGESDFVILSRRKSPRTRSSKRTAPPEVPQAEEEPKKKKQRTDKKKKKKNNKEETNTELSSPSSNRIWSEEEEITILKGLVDFRVKTGAQSKIDWDEFHRVLGGSIVEKFSKNQVYSKIRKLRRKYLVCMEKMNQGNDPNFTSDSEAFGYSQMIWGREEAATDKEMSDELVEEHGAGTENETGREAHQSDSGELKEHEEEAHDESENEALAENVTGSGENILKEQEEEAGNECLNGGNEALAENVTGSGEKNLEQEEEAGNECLNGGNEAVAENVTGSGEKNLDDAFETLMSQGLSSYQKKMQLEKLLSIATDKRRELSDEWKAICVEERSLNIKKLRYSTKLAEACFNGTI